MCIFSACRLIAPLLLIDQEERVSEKIGKGGDRKWYKEDESQRQGQRGNGTS